MFGSEAEPGLGPELGSRPGPALKHRHTVSALILTQNVAPTLPRLLSNIGPVVDEIIIVDGGSRDRTLELVAAEPKAKAISRPFSGDFAAQRNAGLEACAGDWVLSIDSDELLSKPLRLRIPALVQSRIFRWYKIPTYWLVDDRPPLRFVQSPRHYPDYHIRLFRNAPSFRYVPGRPVHERFPKSGRGMGRRLQTGHIFHFALCAPRADREAKVERYRRMLGGADDISAGLYLYEDREHGVLECGEDLA